MICVNMEGESTSRIPQQGNRTLQQHPLENPLILEQLFKYCSTTLHSVKNIRLVSKTWRDLSLAQWRAYTEPQVVIVEDEISDPAPTENNITLSNFIKMRKNVDSIQRKVPQRNIILFSWGTTPVDRLQNLVAAAEPQQLAVAHLRKSFFTLYAPFIKFLTLSKCKFHGIFPVVLQLFVRNVPNVVRLSLEDCRIYADNTVEQGFLLSPGVVDLLLNFETASMEDVNDRAREALNIQKHDKLTSFCIQNLCDGDNDPENFSWTPLMLMFPNLEKIRVGHQVNNDDDSRQFYNLFSTIYKTRLYRNLKSLDLIQNSTVAISSRRNLSALKTRLKLEYLRLEKLSLDIGFKTVWKDVEYILVTQSGTLKELQLYRAPFNTLVCTFPCMLLMPRLTHLHLWGNISGNLDFLGLMPGLQILKWNGSCYEESGNGKKLGPQIGTETSVFSPLFNAKLVQNTNGLGDDFTLEGMHNLELDWEPLTVDCWKKLAAWMPNLTKLKIVVKGEEKLSMIGKLWPGLELLELAHGSYVSAKSILEALTCLASFQKLKGFNWQYCACMRKSNSNEEAEERLCATSMLREMFGDNATNPWAGPYDDIGAEPVCHQAIFENALMTATSSGRNHLRL